VGREVDIRMDIPPVVVDEMSPATWNWGGLRPDPENEISLADRPRVLQSDVERDRFLLIERHRIRQLEVGGAELWRFDPAEAHPGGRVELDSACRLGGDTLLAFDRNNFKLFALHIGESGFTAATLRSNTRLVSDGCLRNGRFVLASTTPSSDGDLLIALKLHSWPASDTGSTVVVLPLPNERRTGWIQPSFGVTDSLIFVAHADSGIVNLYSTTGQLARILRWPERRIPLTREVAQAYFGEDPTRPSDAPRVFVPNLEGPRVNHLPAFLEVHSEPGGLLWIRVPRTIGDTLQEWYVVKNTGQGVAHWLIPEPSADQPTVVVGRVSGRPVLYHEDIYGAPFLRALSD